MAAPKEVVLSPLLAPGSVGAAAAMAKAPAAGVPLPAWLPPPGAVPSPDPRAPPAAEWAVLVLDRA
jgi:tRNA G18 (ribose-2'-O)-methylase SpoU